MVPRAWLTFEEVSRGESICSGAREWRRDWVDVVGKDHHFHLKNKNKQFGSHKIWGQVIMMFYDVLEIHMCFLHVWDTCNAKNIF